MNRLLLHSSRPASTNFATSCLFYLAFCFFAAPSFAEEEVTETPSTLSSESTDSSALSTTDSVQQKVEKTDTPEEKLVDKDTEEKMVVHPLPPDAEEEEVGIAETEGEVQENKKELSETETAEDEKLTTPKRETLGWIERIALVNGEELLLLDAKMSVGTSGNQLHAEEISLIKAKKKNGQKKVRFVINTRDGRSLEILANYAGSTKRGKKKRYTVNLPVCIGKKYMELDFQLSNRSSFEHEVRIGRDALAGHYVVDPAKTKTTRPACSK